MTPQEFKFINQFAVQMLMPADKVKNMIITTIKDNHLDINNLSKNDVDFVVSQTATQLAVSTQALRYRTEDLHIFKEKRHSN